MLFSCWLICPWLILLSRRTDAEILRRQNMLQTLAGRRDELERQERNHTASAVNQRYGVVAPAIRAEGDHIANGIFLFPRQE